MLKICSFFAFNPGTRTLTRTHCGFHFANLSCIFSHVHVLHYILAIFH